MSATKRPLVVIVWKLLAAASLIQQPAPAAPDFAQLSVFATLERDPAWQGLTRIQVGTFTRMGASADVTYWFLREAEDDEGRVTSRAWTSSVLCPAALPVLRSLETLPLPHPDVPGHGRDYDIIVMDGVRHGLSGSARHADGQPGDYSIESNNGTPLARWSDALSRALGECWRSLEAPD